MSSHEFLYRDNYWILGPPPLSVVKCHQKSPGLSSGKLWQHCGQILSEPGEAKACNSYNCKLLQTVHIFFILNRIDQRSLLCLLLFSMFLFCVASWSLPSLGRITRSFLKATPAASSCWLRPLGGYDHRLAIRSQRHRSHGSQSVTVVVSCRGVLMKSIESPDITESRSRYDINLAKQTSQHQHISVSQIINCNCLME